MNEQNQPTADRGEMTAILQEAEEPHCTLYALLAGCGLMRAGEALGLDAFLERVTFAGLANMGNSKTAEAGV